MAKRKRELGNDEASDRARQIIKPLCAMLAGEPREVVAWVFSFLNGHPQNTDAKHYREMVDLLNGYRKMQRPNVDLAYKVRAGGVAAAKETSRSQRPRWEAAKEKTRAMLRKILRDDPGIPAKAAKLRAATRLGIDLRTVHRHIASENGDK